jgi:hypothetical protein
MLAALSLSAGGGTPGAATLRARDGKIRALLTALRLLDVSHRAR